MRRTDTRNAFSSLETNSNVSLMSDAGYDHSESNLHSTTASTTTLELVHTNSMLNSPYDPALEDTLDNKDSNSNLFDPVNRVASPASFPGACPSSCDKGEDNMKKESAHVARRQRSISDPSSSRGCSLDWLQQQYEDELLPLEAPAVDPLILLGGSPVLSDVLEQIPPPRLLEQSTAEQVPMMDFTVPNTLLPHETSSSATTIGGTW